MAQTITIPNENTTYPDGIHHQPSVVSQCMGCHGAQGISQFPDWPNLAGLSQAYIEGEMEQFKSGRRENAMMHVVAQDMTEQEITEAAAFFSEQEVTISAPEDLVRPPQLQTCIACHGDGSTKPSDLGPNIAGQKESYLLEQAHNFRTGKRKNEIMENIVKGMSPESIREVTRYFSQLNIQVNSENGAN